MTPHTRRPRRAGSALQLPDRVSNQATSELPPVRPAQCASRWKSRKAGERALRYIFFRQGFGEKNLRRMIQFAKAQGRKELCAKMLHI